MDKLAQLEGLLFISGDEGITVSELANSTNLPNATVTDLLTQLQTRYQTDEQSALQLLQSDQTYRLATKNELAPIMKRYFEAPLTVPLTNALLEVLAIIAYKQPITRLEIDDIRGVQSSGSIQKLMMRGLIETKGRLDVPGRPFRYVTSAAFLDYFNLATLADLPALPTTDEAALAGDIFLQALQSKQAINEEAE